MKQFKVFDSTPLCFQTNSCNITPKDSTTYDALDNDIALLNVFFGESTAMGKYGRLEQVVPLIQSMSEA